MLSERRRLSALWLALALVGCDDTPTSILSFAVPTEVAVDPVDFLGDTSCSANPGAMRTYVMTLSAFEDQTDTTAFIVGSTAPTPCSLVAGFREVVVVGQSHIAEIDGYDVPPEMLEPFGGTDSASRQMRNVETGEVVLPRWTSTCGAGASGGAIATSSRRAFVRPCDPLSDSGPTPTLIALGPSEVLGAEACDLSPTFDVAPETGNLAPASGVTCDAEPLTYEVTPGTSYELYATTLIDDVAYGTICTARAVSGVTVTARCNPLSPTGQASIHLQGITTAEGTALCPPGGFFDVLAGDDVLNDIPLSCSGTAQVGPLSAGLELLDVAIRDENGADLGRGSCAAEVAPGKTTRALCVADD